MPTQPTVYLPSDRSSFLLDCYQTVLPGERHKHNGKTRTVFVVVMVMVVVVVVAATSIVVVVE